MDNIKEQKEQNLIIAAQKNNEESEAARLELITQYTPMIGKLISSLNFEYGMNKLDLMQAGMVGIMIAINKYDALKSNKAKISTWMYLCIRQQLQQAKIDECAIKVKPRLYKQGYRAIHSEYNDDINGESDKKIEVNEDHLFLLNDIMIFLNRKYPSHYAEIFYKFYFEDFSYKELDEMYQQVTKQVIYVMRKDIRQKFKGVKI